LRAIAVVLVVVSHSEAPHVLIFGAEGVAMFFVLSGFLITTLLLDEREATGSYSICRFYVRRFLRLSPALWVTVAFAFGAELVVHGEIANWSLILGAITYTNNFVMMDGIWPQATPLTQTWSLGVEEQFYLLWPFALLLVARLPKRWAVLTLAWGSALSAWLTIVVHHPGYQDGHYYFGLDVRLNQLLAGAVLAVVLRHSRNRHVNQWWALPCVIAIVATGYYRPTFFLAVIVALLVLPALYFASHSDHGWLSTRPMVWVGRRSYGLYLYHVPIHYLIVALWPTESWWWAGPVTLLTGLAVADVSYRWVEMPFLRLKRRLGSDTRNEFVILVPART
jgi:peptidoglycan/LPS O-acetylase OafA/YrhL